MTTTEIIKELKKHSNPADREGMARFGINPKYALGVRVPVLRALAKKIGRDHRLALALWQSKIHEARILASMIDESDKVTAKQMDSWIKGFNSWDVCDQACMNLFCRLPLAWDKAKEWVARKKEYERRAGFALMACLAWQHKSAKDSEYLKFFPLIKKHSQDGRNYVKKAVNWALRQIGKRNSALRLKALKLAWEIKAIDSPIARWIANDAIRELEGRG